MTRNVRNVAALAATLSKLLDKDRRKSLPPSWIMHLAELLAAEGILDPRCLIVKDDPAYMGKVAEEWGIPKKDVLRDIRNRLLVIARGEHLELPQIPSHLFQGRLILPTEKDTPVLKELKDRGRTVLGSKSKRR